MNENELRRKAEDQLEIRLARGGTVEDREAWIRAVMSALRRDSREPTESAQMAMIRRQEAAREPLPPPATPEQKEAARAWFARMREQLGRPR